MSVSNNAADICTCGKSKEDHYGGAQRCTPDGDLVFHSKAPYDEKEDNEITFRYEAGSNDWSVLRGEEVVGAMWDCTQYASWGWYWGLSVPPFHCGQTKTKKQAEAALRACFQE